MNTALLATLLVAQVDGGGVLKKVDDALNRAKDHTYKYEMVDQQPGKDPRSLKLDVFIKGEKRVTAFTAPADIKGTKVLILSPTRMYVYLPAYKKVRRIASHVTAQGFLGTTYSNDDLAVTTYADKYDAKVLKQDDKQWVVEATKKGSAEVAYPKIEFTVEKARALPTQIRYFDDKGANVKTETRADYKCEGNVCTPAKMKMVDHRTEGHSTELLMKDWKLNSGLSDRIFSKRNLRRGP